MKLTTTIKNFKNNIIGYFNTQKRKNNLLDDLNYTYKFLSLTSNTSAGYIILSKTKSELKDILFKTDNNISATYVQVLGSVKPIYFSTKQPQNNILELDKNSNLLDSYTDMVHIIRTVSQKADDIIIKYTYNGKYPIEFKLDSHSANDGTVTTIFIYNDVLYIAERKGTTSTNYEYGNGFEEWFNNNFKE